MLGELVGCFLDLFRGKILPAGSTVVLFSATHLLMRGLSELEKSLIGALITELNNLFNLGLGTDTIHDRLIEQQDTAAIRRYLFIGRSHAATEGNVMADRGHEVIVCAVSGWRPNKTAVEEMAAMVEEALLELPPNDVIVLHLFDNVAYMV